MIVTLKDSGLHWKNRFCNRFTVLSSHLVFVSKHAGCNIYVVYISSLLTIETVHTALETLILRTLKALVRCSYLLASESCEEEIHAWENAVSRSK